MSASLIKRVPIERAKSVGVSPVTMAGVVIWGGIYSSLFFLVANVRTIDVGSGYLFLLPALGCTVLVLLLSGDTLRGVVLQPSAKALLAFLVYFLLKLLVDLPDTADIRAYTIGTDGGIVFALLLGIMLNALVGRQSERRLYSEPALLVFLGVCLVVAADTFRIHFGQVRADIFLITDSDSYQRPGNFVILTAILISTQLAMCWDARRAAPRRRSWCGWAGIAAYVAIIGVLLATTQLFGSNAAFVVTSFVALATLAWCSGSRGRRLGRIVRFLHEIDPLRLLWRMVPRLALIGAISAVLAGAAIAVLLAYTGLEARQFRIFGFEDGVYLRSLESRFEILQSNFITHFAYNPWLGDLRVDELTTGEGTYAHSLISLFSHLGIVGGLLFALYLVAIVREARRPSPSALPFYGSPDLGLFKLVIMAGVIGFACIATFFRWLPLWACLGFFYGPFVLRQPQVLRVRYEARDRRTVGPASA